MPTRPHSSKKAIPVTKIIVIANQNSVKNSVALPIANARNKAVRILDINLKSTQLEINSL
ncbi:MAG: hypothetical protein CMP88_02330 [Gammaproteobacteria bacterium]|nr:hypothetical protein [Gammaproteobacteria bacterium]